jgi:lysophospholipase L1-like esterase
VNCLRFRSALYLFALVALLQACKTGTSQPFAAEIEAFKQQDRRTPPAPGSILFVGSSSFRFWTHLQDSFPSVKVINRGFGGSTLADVIRYSDQVIFAYQPSQIIIYCGENDIAMDTASADVVLSRFLKLFDLIRTRLPDVPVSYVSIKPSPSRFQYLPVVKESNRLIAAFLKTRPNTSFIDVFPLMLGENGYPRGELFGPDSLHMNERGYAIWKKAIEPHLKAAGKR